MIDLSNKENTHIVLKRNFNNKRQDFFVKDDEIVANVIEWRLDNLGYSICGSAKNGVDGIALIKEKEADLVLLDIELKGSMDGIDVRGVPLVTDKKSFYLHDIPY